MARFLSETVLLMSQAVVHLSYWARETWHTDGCTVCVSSHLWVLVHISTHTHTFDQVRTTLWDIHSRAHAHIPLVSCFVCVCVPLVFFAHLHVSEHVSSSEAIVGCVSVRIHMSAAFHCNKTKCLLKRGTSFMKLLATSSAKGSESSVLNGALSWFHEVHFSSQRPHDFVLFLLFFFRKVNWPTAIVFWCDESHFANDFVERVCEPSIATVEIWNLRNALDIPKLSNARRSFVY